ncbi:low molecular weight protein-tyrosine-phosphatase [Kordiimonas laminariae]|uniref:low molecular weight protein-tyrosine-phosphatase n=1 Tax=Kordiimonas laminariae TaxID=2917717 RepID=UPI001FF644ED|nr:low molecular weight protein-tyrosine-phosphatase [Kordiimonas laminariae]MCK0069204.1 low molecular weight phosphotyrosine protein phosphatase [Kordiimonas laminariae]
MVAVLFVCMGNICRSPMAEGTFRDAVKSNGLEAQFMIDSAGTTGYHAGEAPDPRARETSKKNGIDIGGQRSRKVTQSDFEEFDYILAMDEDNMSDLFSHCPQEHQHKITLFLSHAPHLPINEMPDPYYGHDRGFDMCFNAAVDASDGLLNLIKKEQSL